MKQNQEDTNDGSESDDEANDDTKRDGKDNVNDNNKACKFGKNVSTEGSVKQCLKKQNIVELS